jgi:hypothetical protein
MLEVLMYLSIFSTIVFLIFFILTFVGLHDIDVDHHDSSHDFKLLSIRNIFTFLTIFGWSSLAFLKDGHSLIFSMIFSSLLGLFVMFSVAWFLWMMYKQAIAAKLNYDEVVGKTAEVYYSIAPNIIGEIIVMISGKKMHVNALNKSNIIFTTGMQVKVSKFDKATNTFEIVENK